ncbi:MAG: redoxin domain-containing protein [Bacteroidales bacterium]|nr:redoxin domain-containing protein [Bacteroidales bacterium]
MKNCRILLIAAAISLVLASCSDSARISGTLESAPDTDVVFKLLSGNTMTVLDTVTTDASGRYSYKMPVAKGHPEFVYAYKGDTRIASLILLSGDNVKVVSDTLGKFSVEGSEESVKLQQVENEFSDFLRKMASFAEEGDRTSMTKEYIDYYRSRVSYVVSNSKSLSSIPVLYQSISESFPVFSQATDAIHFQALHDSLATLYPESKYVLSLGEDAKKRMNAMGIASQIKDAKESGYPDVEMPDVNGRKVKISDIDAKVIMVYFWTATDPGQKMFNQDVLVPVYNEWHDKGFEIYSVSFDADKGLWASTVKSQNLPWINVNDGLGLASKTADMYNTQGKLPIAFLIIDGVLVNNTVQGANELRKILSSNL